MKSQGITDIYSKSVILATIATDSPIQASAQAHPAALSKEDAEALNVPHLVLASKEEPKEDVEVFDSAKKPPGSEVHTFTDMVHGWMGARADLADKHCSEEFQRGCVCSASSLH